MVIRLLLAVFLLQDVTSYPMYQKRIPNGEAVPFLCKPGQIWAGVGHLNSAGTGDRNPFGLDFAAADHVWTVDLCRKDSDGDGKSNGAELGDPDCVWNVTATSTSANATSHPGICDPWDSLECSQKVLKFGKYATQKQWLEAECKSGGFVCPAVNETGVKTLSLRIPMTSVPAKVTTYECQIFDLIAMGIPADQDFHIVAVTPIIDNRNVLHHMVITGCTNNTAPTSKPFECGMQASITCNEFMHVWTVGLAGECYHPQSGVRIGRNGFKIVAIQLHWNNPAEAGDMKDSSGLQIYYTPKLRPYDAGVIMIGSSMFNLPPKRSEVIVKSTCASSCTKQYMPGPINITSAWNHMHDSGREMHIEILRSDATMFQLTDDKKYSYDSPIVNLYPTPLVLQPGDQMKTTCNFNTENKNKTTSFGEATSDEMCLGFITYYPKDNFTSNDCADQMGISICNPSTLQGCTNYQEFFSNNSSIFKEVASNCRKYAPCVAECVDTLINYTKTSPCFRGIVWEYLQNILALYTDGEFMSRVLSCKSEVAMAMQQSQGDTAATSGASVLALVMSAFVVAMFT